MKTLFLAVFLIFSCSCGQTLTGAKEVSTKSGENSVDTISAPNADNTVLQPETLHVDVESTPNSEKAHADALVVAALALTLDDVVYDGRYFSIPYPNGDVPSHIGVCTDVVIRAYRKLDIDLQKEVHEDMAKNFNLYPKNWGLKKTDKNIDHRRVPNLMTYFKRFGKEKAISEVASDYQPGDIVCWMLPGNLTHIGVVVNRKSRDGKRYMIVHNIGGGQVLEDCLFDFKIIGHYAY